MGCACSESCDEELEPLRRGKARMERSLPRSRSRAALVASRCCLRARARLYPERRSCRAESAAQDRAVCRRGRRARRRGCCEAGRSFWPPLGRADRALPARGVHPRRARGDYRPRRHEAKLRASLRVRAGPGPCVPRRSLPREQPFRGCQDVHGFPRRLELTAGFRPILADPVERGAASAGRHAARPQQLGSRTHGRDDATDDRRRRPGQPLWALRDGDPMDQAIVIHAARDAVARAAMLSALALLAGCAAQPAQPTTADGDLVRATPVSETAKAQLIPLAAELVQPDDPEIQAAMRAWKSGQPAPIIRTTEFIQYPYGLTEAVVTCEPLRDCDVELDAGEEVQNVSIGDTSRWLVHPAFSGARETLTPHVMVKPSEYGIATNAIITTNRRTYYLRLVSKAKNDHGYVRRVKFY